MIKMTASYQFWSV